MVKYKKLEEEKKVSNLIWEGYSRLFVVAPRTPYRQQILRGMGEW